MMGPTNPIGASPLFASWAARLPTHRRPKPSNDPLPWPVNDDGEEQAA